MGTALEEPRARAKLTHSLCMTTWCWLLAGAGARLPGGKCILIAIRLETGDWTPPHPLLSPPGHGEGHITFIQFEVDV